MAILPTARDITLAPGDPIPSALLNKLQDCIIGKKHPLITRWYPPLSRTANDVNMTFTNGDYHANANAASINYVSAPLFVGDTFGSLKARVKGTGGAGNVVARLTRWRDGVQAVIATLTIVNPPAAWATYSFAFSDIVLDGDAYWLNCDFALTNQAINSFGLEISRL